MNVRNFSLILGLIFLVLGAGAFVPGFTTPHSHPDVRMTGGLGLAAGLFPVNHLHDIVHIAFGLWGVAVFRSPVGAVVYARVTAIVYALLTVMGLVPALNLHATFGLIPLYGHDVWLHAVIALSAAYFGFSRVTRAA